MTEQDVFAKLAPLVTEVTGVATETIAMNSEFMGDLGAESIDLLDLAFLIEERFSIMIGPDEFERQVARDIPGGVYERDGYLTDEALVELRKALPEVRPDRLRPGLRKIELPSVLTVAVFVHLIQRKLAAAEAANAL